MQGLWTNRNSLRDFVQNGLRLYQSDVSEVYVAVAFFTESEIVKEFVNNSCHIRLIVRLGFPTNPKALSALINNPNVEVRYYSDKSFHPKLYIFGDRIAFVGSANLTRKALLTNQEVVVSIEPDDPRFNELTSLFSDYWNEAQVLTPDIVSTYEGIYKKHSKSINDISNIDDETESIIGKTVFPNIDRGSRRKSKENVFLDNYRKTYQESVAAFEKIKAIYESKSRRKNRSCEIPIRLEIDSFFSFVRDMHAVQEKWKEAPAGWTEDRRILLSEHIDEWLDIDWPHFDVTICNKNYPRIVDVFGSKDSIWNASYEDLVDAMVVLHSFHDRLRFFPGGLSTLINAFKARNKLEKVKSSFIHLLFGKGDIVKRMADLIYDSSFKLSEFGQSNAQELVGWINKEELPVINGRTTKVLRYYGFEVRQL